jgi:hypothetical protein
MTTRRYTLSPMKRHEVHGVERSRTICGLYLAFAPDPQETADAISCQACMRTLRQRYPELEQQALELPKEKADALMATVREYGSHSRMNRYAAADKALLEIIRMVRGDYPHALEAREQDQRMVANG